MYCGNNKTALTSQRQIAQALLDLMADKPFEEISICELCKSAGISRQTFYSLFSSRENVIAFILQEKTCYSPADEPESPSAKPEKHSPCGLRAICRGYSEYIHYNRDFLRLLVTHHIDYLLYDSVYESLADCTCFLPETEACTRRYAAGFLAGGVSSVARIYAMEGCTCSVEDLEEMLHTFFTGKLFHR